MSVPALTRPELLAWLKAQHACVFYGYREQDGKVRNRDALHDLRAIRQLRELVRGLHSAGRARSPRAPRVKRRTGA